MTLVDKFLVLAEVVSSLEHLSTRTTNIGLFRPVGDLVLTKLGVGTKSFVALITGLKLNMNLVHAISTYFAF